MVGDGARIISVSMDSVSEARRSLIDDDATGAPISVLSRFGHDESIDIMESCQACKHDRVESIRIATEHVELRLCLLVPVFRIQHFEIDCRHIYEVRSTTRYHHVLCVVRDKIEMTKVLPKVVVEATMSYLATPTSKERPGASTDALASPRIALIDAFCVRSLSSLSIFRTAKKFLNHPSE